MHVHNVMHTSPGRTDGLLCSLCLRRGLSQQQLEVNRMAKPANLGSASDGCSAGTPVCSTIVGHVFGHLWHPQLAGAWPPVCAAWRGGLFRAH